MSRQRMLNLFLGIFSCTVGSVMLAASLTVIEDFGAPMFFLAGLWILLIGILVTSATLKIIEEEKNKEVTK